MFRNKNRKGSEETESKVSSTILKVREIGYTDYFSEPWPNELKFKSYREISEFLFNVALFGDEKFFEDSINAMKTVLLQNPEHEEATYFKFKAKELSESNNKRAEAVGISLLSYSEDTDEKDFLLEKARSIILKPINNIVFDKIANEAAISIIFQNGSDIDKENSLIALMDANEETKYNVIGMLNPGNKAETLILAVLMEDKNEYIAKSATEKLYRNANLIKKEAFSAISHNILKALTLEKSKLDEGNKDKNKIHPIAGLVVEATIYAAPNDLMDYPKAALNLVKSDNPYVFGIGYVMIERLKVRNLIYDRDIPEQFYKRIRSFEFFKEAYRISVESSGASYKEMDAYESYMQKMALLLEDGSITKQEYKKMEDLKEVLEHKEDNRRDNARILFGVFNAGTTNYENKAFGSASVFKVTRLDDAYYNAKIQDVIDSVFAGEIKGQSWLSKKISEVNPKNEYRAYWNILRFESKAFYRAAKNTYAIASESEIFPDYMIGSMKFEIIKAKASMIDNRLYLMHEVDTEARFSAVEGLAVQLSNLNKRIIEGIKSYAKDNGVFPNESYENMHESLMAHNSKQLEYLKDKLRR